MQRIPEQPPRYLEGQIARHIALVKAGIDPSSLESFGPGLRMDPTALGFVTGTVAKAAGMVVDKKKKKKLPVEKVGGPTVADLQMKAQVGFLSKEEVVFF